MKRVIARLTIFGLVALGGVALQHLTPSHAAPQTTLAGHSGAVAQVARV